MHWRSVRVGGCGKAFAFYFACFHMLVSFFTSDMLRSMSSSVVLNLFFIAELFCTGLVLLITINLVVCASAAASPLCSIVCFISIPSSSISFLDNKMRTNNKMPHWRNESTKNYKLDTFSKSFQHCPKLTSYYIFCNSATKRSTKYMRCSLCHEVVTKPATQFSITSIKK